MDHRKLENSKKHVQIQYLYHCCCLFLIFERRTNENTSTSEEAKVGLADDTIAIVSIGQKKESRQVKGSIEALNLTAIFTETLLLSPIPRNFRVH